MVEGNASMYSGRLDGEMVIGEKVTLEEMGGARMHATVSGLADALVASDEDAIAPAGATCLFPQNWTRCGAGATLDARRPCAGHTGAEDEGAASTCSN